MKPLVIGMLTDAVTNVFEATDTVIKPIETEYSAKYKIKPLDLPGL